MISFVVPLLLWDLNCTVCCTVLSLSEFSSRIAAYDRGGHFENPCEFVCSAQFLLRIFLLLITCASRWVEIHVCFRAEIILICMLFCAIWSPIDVAISTFLALFFLILILFKLHNASIWNPKPYFRNAPCCIWMQPFSFFHQSFIYHFVDRYGLFLAIFLLSFIYYLFCYVCYSVFSRCLWCCRISLLFLAVFYQGTLASLITHTISQNDFLS